MYDYNFVGCVHVVVRVC